MNFWQNPGGRYDAQFEPWIPPALRERRRGPFKRPKLNIANCLPFAELEAQHVALISKHEGLTFPPTRVSQTRRETGPAPQRPMRQRAAQARRGSVALLCEMLAGQLSSSPAPMTST